MFDCPNCRHRLIRIKTQQGFIHRCPHCDGRAVSLAVLRRAVSPAHVKRLWLLAQEQEHRRGQDCPVCRRRMQEVVLPVGEEAVGEEAVTLDVCRGCQFVWFDPTEFERLPVDRPTVPKGPPQPRSPKAREALAMAQLEVDQKRIRGGDFGGEPPDEDWKWIPALFGMPVEHDVTPIRCWPWLTWTLAALMVLTLALTYGNLRGVIDLLGLIPAEAGRFGGLTFITSFFLHAGLMHLIGNVYFLLVFGDNVEDHLGHWRYALLIALAALAGALLHIAADPRDTIPCVGASGGISGVIVFYALRFPEARLGLMFRWWFVFRWIYLPAYVALIGWLVLQCALAYSQLAGASNVSALAHLGGAAVGFAAWALWRRHQATDKREEPIKSMRRDPGRRAGNT